MAANGPDQPAEIRARTDGAGEARGPRVEAGRYRLQRVIARGGMGLVYLAEHVHLKRPVALKILTPPPGADDDGSFEKRFRLEAETLASLDHANIVTLYDYGQLEDGRFFLAMEFINGPRFTDILRDGPLPADRAVRLLLQVCAALRYAHRRNLVHRDLKPSNLLIRVDDDGREVVKVVDFGLVKVAEVDQTLTKAGHVLGSPHCMAPEQVHGGDVDPRADIYAIGVLLFRSVTGHYPFHGSTSAATMIAHLKEPVPSLQSVAPEITVPAGFEDVVQRCLAKEPDDRYQIVEDVMADLATCLDVPVDQFQSVSISHSTLGELPGPPPSPAPAPAPSRSWVGVAVGLVLAAVVALSVGVLLWDRGQSPDPAAPALVATPPTTPPSEPTVVNGTARRAVEVPAEEPVEPDAVPAEEAPAKAKPAATPKASTQPRTPAKATPEAAPDAGGTDEAPKGYKGLPDDF